MKRPDICIYHGNCADGFTAAWAVWKRWPDIEFFPGVYGEEPPDVRGKRVLMVDFSYKLPVIQRMGEVATSITILDHHKTAQADLAPFIVPQLGDDPQAFVDEGLGGLAGPYPVQAIFDMEKSGAALAWEHVRGGGLPALVAYVQDRDLWRFKLPDSRAINATIFSYAYTFENWERLAYDVAHNQTATAGQGEAIERKHFKDIAELLKITTREMVIGGHRVKVANLPYTMSSDAAGALAEGAPFGACYFDRNDGQRIFSLRSKPDGLDVADIAKSYGGGGHARASGFQMPIGWEGDQSAEGTSARNPT